YVHENIWKGSLHFSVIFPLTDVSHNLFLGKDYHKYAGFLVFSLCVSLWLICSGAFRRRLEIDHKKKEYRYYIHTHLRHRGPLHQIYIRPVLFFHLQYAICHKDPSLIYVLYPKLMECQGRRIATELNLNYFDYQDTSKHHLVVHWPKNNHFDVNDFSNPPV
uniref:Uncharacterized protein n=1 Tax=Esox lucius TaxID=8010 RepID=A0A3P8XMU0_ESOLU